jgi:hypothetical protein
MAHLSLPNSELHVGLRAAGVDRLEALCRAPGTAVLFPSEGATDVRALREPPPVLVVVDGTWSNAKKVVQNCPLLSALPRVSLTPDRPGNYRIRKEPEAHCLSTIEAVAAVLEHLEGAPGRFTPILAAFDHMVEQQLDFIRSTGANSRHRRTLKRRNSVREDPTAAMKADAARLVVVFGEANAWPADAANRPLPDVPELLALVAERVATGESFEALMQARRPLSPSVPCQLDLPAEALEAAEPRALALARWSEYLRPDDVLVGWGPFCASLLQAEGLRERRFIDLRAVLARWSSRRPGSVEACAALLGASLPHGKGRAPRRLMALAIVARATLTGELQARLA